LALGEDVHAGRELVGVVERAHAHEAHELPAAAVMAPQCDAAPGASRDQLALAAFAGRVDQLDLAAQILHAIGFGHRVERERRTRLALAPAAVAAIDEERAALHAVADVLAVAAAFERFGGGAAHFFFSHSCGPVPWSNTIFHCPRASCRQTESK